MSKKEKQTTVLSIPNEHLEKRIYFIRGLKVMLDSDLAELYGVETRRSFKRSSEIGIASPRTL